MSQPAPIFKLKAACHISHEEAENLAICDKQVLESIVDEVDRALSPETFSGLLAACVFMTPHKATCLNPSVWRGTPCVIDRVALTRFLSRAADARQAQPTLNQRPVQLLLFPVSLPFNKD